MSHRSLGADLLVLGVVLAGLRVQGNNLYVAPDGASAGPGTLSQPYDLATALSGQVGKAGDTFWLRGGDYKLGHLDTSVQGAGGRSITFRGVPGENPRIDGSLTIYNSSGHVILRDFEIYSSDTNRVSAQTGVGFNVTDIKIVPGVACFAPNVSLINLVVHDQTRHGIYLAENSTNCLVYGCIVYNNGWVSPDNAEGHGLYIQGEGGTRTVAENMVFNNSGANLHVYENADGRSLRGVVLQGNAAFHAGAIQQVRAYRDWIVGVDSPAVTADKIVMKDNMGYEPTGQAPFAEVQIGRDSINGKVTVTGNYMPVGLEMNNWRNATISRNLFAATPTNYAVALDRSMTPLRAQWNNNTYVDDPEEDEFLLNLQTYDLSGWQQTTGYDRQSKSVSGAPRGTKVFVRRNRYEKGRANIIVYNWDSLDTVSVNVSSVLRRNRAYEVRNAQDLSADPVLNGVFHGEQLQLPMKNLTVAPVTGPQNGPLVTAPPTGPTFNVFIVRVK